MRDDGEGSRDEKKIPAEAYLRALSQASVPVDKRQWYVRWVERFSAFLGETPLHAADRGDAEAFIASLGRRPRTEAGQIRQATDAVRVLVTAVFGKSRLPARGSATWGISSSPGAPGAPDSGRLVGPGGPKSGRDHRAFPRVPEQFVR